MAIAGTAVWRVRLSGNNLNGGGFDCSLSAAATGTHGSFTGTTFTDATAAAFTAGQVGSSINITNIGQYKITAFINASNITLGSGNPAITTPTGLAWTVGNGTDYSQQDTAQASGSNATAAQNSTTFVDATANAFTSAMIGNCIQIASGTNFVAGFYFVTAFTSASTVTLDRAPATAGAGSAGVWKLGGGWADPATNAGSTVNNNVVYLLGSGTPNPSSYVYDYSPTTAITPTAGLFFLYNDPATPGYKQPPDTTGGMPTIRMNTAGTNIFLPTNTSVFCTGLWFVFGASSSDGASVVSVNNGQTHMYGCVFDQFIGSGGRQLVASAGGTTECFLEAVEVFCSTATSGGGVGKVINAVQWFITGCNFHDTDNICIASVGGGGTNNATINTIFSSIGGTAIQLSAGITLVQNCTFDGNASIATNFAGQLVVIGNIFSNSPGTALNPTTGPVLAQDYNVFYNNVTNSSENYGPHDTLLGSDPYVGRSTQNYTLK